MFESRSSWAHQAHITLSEPMITILKQVSNLGSGLTFPSPNSHYKLTFGSLTLCQVLSGVRQRQLKPEMEVKRFDSSVKVRNTATQLNEGVAVERSKKKKKITKKGKAWKNWPDKPDNSELNYERVEKMELSIKTSCQLNSPILFSIQPHILWALRAHITYINRKCSKLFAIMLGYFIICKFDHYSVCSLNLCPPRLLFLFLLIKRC